MGKNNAEAPTLPRIRCMCFDSTHAPVATTARAAATGPVSIIRRSDVWAGLSKTPQAAVCATTIMPRGMATGMAHMRYHTDHHEEKKRETWRILFCQRVFRLWVRYRVGWAFGTAPKTSVNIHSSRCNHASWLGKTTRLIEPHIKYPLTNQSG